MDGMRYLLVTQVPFGRTPDPAVVLAGDMWLEDLRVQAAEIGRRGRLLLATPLYPVLGEEASGSFQLARFSPAAEGVEYHPLPPIRSWAELALGWPAWRRRLETALAGCDLVQLDTGGFPLPLGRLGWPLAGRQGRARIWVFDGGDPVSVAARAAHEMRFPPKRWLKLLLVRRLEAFCAKAVGEADLVFCHNHSVVQRFARQWHERCHFFHRTFVRAETLIDEAGLEDRIGRLLRPGEPLRLAAAGRQIAIKGTDRVLRAVAGARAAGAAVELVVLGEGAMLPAYKELAARLGLGGAVRFAGHVPYGAPLFAELARCHALVVTNLTAEISRNVLLGMARGLALVLFRNPATDGLVEPSGAAWLVDPADPEGLTAALAAAARGRDRLAEMVRRGLALARANTLDECHRRRAALAAECLRSRGGGKGEREA